MRRVLFILLFLCGLAVPAFAQESELSGGGSSAAAGSITNGGTPLTANVIPYATAGTTLADSPLVRTSASVVTSSASLLPSADNTLDLGTSAAAWRTAYLDTSLVLGGDGILVRDAANVIAQRNAANAQALRVYGTYTGGSDYERAALTTTAGTGISLIAETAGTGGDNLGVTLTPAGTGNVLLSSGRLQFGGTADTSPALKATGEALEVIGAAGGASSFERYIQVRETPTLIRMGYSGGAGTYMIDTAGDIGFTIGTIGNGNVILKHTNTARVTLSSSALTSTLPVVGSADNTVDIGTSVAAWRTAYVATSIQGANTKALAAAAATPFVRVACATESFVGGYIVYTIHADDATEFQARSGIVPFAIVNKGGTETVTLGTVDAGTEVVAVSSGTLTNTFTGDTTPANAIDFSANAASSLTETTLAIKYRVVITSGSATVTPQ